MAVGGGGDVEAGDVEDDLLPDSVVQTPEDSIPRIRQPIWRVRKVQVSVSGTGEVLRPVARTSHLMAS